MTDKEKDLATIAYMYGYEKGKAQCITEEEKQMKPEARATNQMLREAAFKLTVAIIEGKLRKAEYHAQTVITLINHLKKGSQQ